MPSTSDHPRAVTTHYARGACPTCGRRLRVQPSPALAPLPLFDWSPPPPRPAVRLVMLHHLPDPDGLPRPGLLVPGQRVPVPFRSIAAAMRAKAVMEARA